MRQIDLEQGSAEWLAYRFKHDNASDAGTVMNVNPYKTRRQLFDEIKNKTVWEGNAATRHGNNMEAAARAKVSELLGVALEPAVFEEGRYSASLDAYGKKDGKTYKVEIKCPYSGERSDTWQRMCTDSTSPKDLIPPHYFWQMVHQQYVVPTNHTYYFVYLGDDKYKFCSFNPTGDQIEELIAAWEEFWADEPEPDYLKIEDEGILQAVDWHRTLTAEKKDLELRLKGLEHEIKLRVEQNSIADGTKLTWVTRKGNINYKKIPDLANVDVEKYRGKESRYLKITHGEVTDEQ